MLSLAAMAALPMAGLADTTWQVSSNPTQDWTPEAGTTVKENSTPEEIIAFGKSISYTVTLPQGKYKLLSGKRTNANFVVTWDTYSFTNEASVDIDLAKETEVTLTLSAASYGENFSIKGLCLKLEFGFGSAKEALAPRLGSYTYDDENDTYDYTSTSTNYVFADINALPDEIEGTTVNFVEFKKTLLADGRALSDVIEKFKDVEFADPSDPKAEEKADGKAAFELYCQQELWKYNDEQNPTDLEKNLAKLERVIALYDDLTTKKTDIQSAWSGIGSDESGEYTKNVYQPVVAKFVEDLNAELGQLEANYAANTLPTEADITKKYSDKYTDLTQSFVWYKGVKGAFIAAEDAKAAQLTAISEAKTAIDEDPATLAPAGITDKLKTKAEASLNKRYEPVAEALTAFTSIIVDANAEDPYKALVEFHKNEDYKLSGGVYDVAGDVLENAKTSMAVVADKYFKNTNSDGYYDQLDVEFQKVYGATAPKLVQRYNEVKAANALYKEKYGKNIDDITDAKLKAISDSITYIGNSFQNVVSDIKADSEPTTLTIKYYKSRTYNSTTGEYTLKGVFTLDDVGAKIDPLETAVSDKGNKAWIDACNALNTRLDALKESLSDFKTKLQTSVDIADYNDPNKEGLSLTVDGELVYDAYEHWKDYAYAEYVEGGENTSLTAQITALEKKIKAYSANELYINSVAYNELANATNGTVTVLGKAITDFKDYYKNAERATRLYGIYGGKLNAWIAAYAEKNEIITDKNIYQIYDEHNSSNNVTYGDLLNQFQTGISKLQMEIDLAMAKTGIEHYNKLAELYTNRAQYDDALYSTIMDVTRDSYKSDKTTYALQVRYEDVNAQISWCQNEAKDLKKSLDDLQTELTNNAAYYGNGLAELNGAANSTDTATFNGIMNVFKGIEYVNVSNSDVYTLAHLDYNSLTSTFEEADAKYEIVKVDFEKIFKLSQAFTALNTKAEAVKKAFELNNTLYTRYYNWVNKGYYTDDTQTVPQTVYVFDSHKSFEAEALTILNTNVDSSKRAAMQEKFDAIKKSVTDFTADLEDFKDNETIAANKETIENTLASIKNDVEDLRTKVTGHNNNYNAYVYLKNKWNNALWVDVKDKDGNVTGQITYAEKVANGIAASTAHNVFKAQAKAYEGTANDDAKQNTVFGVSKYIDSAYADGTASTSQAVYEAKITGLVDAIDQVAKNCNLNDANYGILEGKYKQAAGLYKVASDKAISDVKEAWLKDLRPAWNKYMDAYDGQNRQNLDPTENAYAYKSYKSFYEAGKLVNKTGVDYTYYADALDAAIEDITAINATYNANYNADVCTSNDKLHADFLEKHAAAVVRYNEILASLQKFVDNGYEKGTIAQGIKDLYEIANHSDNGFEALKAKEAEKYWETVENNNDSESTSTLVLSRDYRDSYLVTLQDAIETEYLSTVRSFNAVVDDAFDEAFDAAKAAVEAVVTLDGNYKVTGINDSDPENQLADYYETAVVQRTYTAIADLLKKADIEYRKDGELIFNIDTYVAELAGVHTGDASRLAKAKEQLAVNQVAAWESEWRFMNTKIQDLFAEYADLATGKVDGRDYKTEFQEAYDAFKKAVAAIGTPTYDNIEAVVDAAKDNSVYNTFTSMINNEELSNKKYEEFMTDANKAKIADVKAKYDAAAAYVNGEYACTTKLDEVYEYWLYLTDEVEKARNSFKFHNIVTTAKNKLTSAESAANILLPETGAAKVNSDEYGFLTGQLTYLKTYLQTHEYSQTDMDEINSINKNLQDLNAAGLKSTAAVKTALVGYQKKIADLRTKITDFNAKDVKAELVKMAEANSATYEAATAKIETLFDFQKPVLENLYTKDPSVAEKEEVENDKFLVFNAEDHKAAIEKTANDMAVYALKVQAAVDAKTTHEETCDKIVGMLQSDGEYGKKFAELQAKMAGFDKSVQEKFAEFVPYYEANAAERAAHYAAVKAEPEGNTLLKATEVAEFDQSLSEYVAPQSAARAAAAAPANPFTEVCDTFEEFFDYVDKVCSKKEVDVRTIAFTDAKDDIKNGIQSLFDAEIIKADPQYIVNVDELDEEIKTQRDLINEAYTALYTYIGEAYAGALNSDINGNEYVDENGNPAPVEVNFVADCLQAIFDKLDELNAAVEKVISDTEENIYYYGDVDHDKVVDVNDFASLKLHILGYAEHQLEGLKLRAADTNKDNKVNAADLTRMVTMILNGERFAAPARVVSSAVVNDALAVVAEGEGVHQRIGIMLDAERVYAGCQMDILLPEGVTLVGESLGEMADGLSLSSNDLENGCHRVLLSSIEGNAMNTGNGAMLWLDVEVGHNYNGEGIELSNILFADGAGRGYELSVASGETTGLSNVSMTQEVKEKIYNVGGILMDSLKRGVNIIRGNDGSSKKIVK